MKGLFAGLNTVDLQFVVDKYPGINTKTLVEKNNIFTGGPATNAAITFSSLGGNAALATFIGNHYFTEFVISELKTYNVELYDAGLNKNANPIISSIITSGDTGDRTILTVDPDQFNKNTDNFYGFFGDISEKALKSSDIVLIDCFYIEGAIIIAREAKKLSIPVVIDGGSWKNGMDNLLDFVDIAICSENFYPPGYKTSKGVFDYLSLKNCEKIAITRGEEPILYKEKNNYGEIHVPEINAVDTLGAGDIFHGAFCFYFLKENNFTEALGKATAVATESCRYIGTREWVSKLK
jgi:sugar/nucleoside kinase (ribokinase family)